MGLGTVADPMAEVIRGAFSEQAWQACPRCDGPAIAAVASINRASARAWFRCETCGHMWAVERDGNAQREHHPDPGAWRAGSARCIAADDRTLDYEMKAAFYRLRERKPVGPNS
jgi:hypothetical protein